jgi:hypothetical protein
MQPTTACLTTSGFVYSVLTRLAEGHSRTRLYTEQLVSRPAESALRIWAPILLSIDSHTAKWPFF